MKGTPGSSQAPEAPSDAMTIDVVRVAPYPSHPMRLSADTLGFFNTKIANENYNNRRMDAYRVKGSINSAQRSSLQPRGYTMVDIGALDRRLQTLERYVAYTLVEALTQQRVIPSSANTNIDRFKFGFFVDGFDNYNYAETSNPQYNASIINGYLSPKVEEINLPLISVGGGTTTSLPFVEKSLFFQPDATNGPVVTVNTATTNTATTNTATTNTATTNTVTTNTAIGNTNVETGTITVTPVVQQNTAPTAVTQTISVVESQKNTLNSDAGIYYDDFYYTFSESAGAAEFYINSRDNNIGVLIFQSSSQNGPWTTITKNSGSDAVPIETADIYSKGLTGLNGNRSIEHPGSLDIKGYYFYGTSVWHEDQFKLLWNHNPASGRYYLVRVFKGKKHGGLFGGQGSAGTYGFKLFYPADVQVTSTDYINGWTSTLGYDMSFYIGALSFDGSAYVNPINYDFTGLNPSSPGINPSDPGVIAAEQGFSIRITGLRPDTNHTFLVEGANKTSSCRQTGTVLGAGLKSDSNGVLEFVYYYYPTIASVDVTSEAAAATEMVAASKAVQVINTDGSSSAQSVIQVKNYIKKVFNAPPVTAANVSVETIDNGPGGGGGGREFIYENNVNFV